MTPMGSNQQGGQGGPNGLYWGNSYVPYNGPSMGPQALQSPVSPMASQYNNPFTYQNQMAQYQAQQPQYQASQQGGQYAPGQESVNGGAQNQGIQRYAPLAGMALETMGGINAYNALGKKTPAQEMYERNISMLSNPNDPHLKEMIGAEANARQGDFLKSLRDFRLADQRSRAQGKGAIMGGDRQDENMFNAIRQGMEMSQTAGRNAAYSRLADQTNVLPMAQGWQAQQAEARRQGQAGQVGIIGEVLKKYPLVENGIFGGRPVAGGSPSDMNQNLFRGGYGAGTF